MNVLREIFRLWTWRMAWRDSRAARGNLVLFSLSISLGVGALVTIQSLGRNVQRAISQQAKSLLGADLVLSSRSPLTSEDEAWIATIAGEQARETSFSTMLTAVAGTRLVNARAMSGRFPFYGNLETLPPEASGAFYRDEGVLVEESLLQQFGIGPGDSVRLGKASFRVLGALKKVPGENIALGALAPRVYFPAKDLDRTGLLKGVSLARHKIYFRLSPEIDPEKWVRTQAAQLKQRHLESDTVARRQRDLGRAMENLFRFLNLVALVSLILGAIGVASAVQVHLRRKIPSVAVLRCLGASMASTFAIYLAQSAGLGGIGSLTGVVLGLIAAALVPRGLRGVLPMAIESHVEWSAAMLGGLVGLAICLIFTLLPLMQVRRVSPLAAIRAAYEKPVRRDRSTWATYMLMIASVGGFAALQTPRWYEGLAFTAGLGTALGLLACSAQFLVFLARLAPLDRLPFVARQGFASLHRPNNRTMLLLVSLGLGTFLLVTLQLTRTVLLKQLFPPGQQNGPNALLFDIQLDQRAGLAALFKDLQLPVLNESPVVTMRLQSLKGVATEVLTNRKPDRIPEWLLRREYRATWRTNLVDAERLVAGAFSPGFVGEPSSNHPVPVSLEASIARELHVGLGDTLEFDVQGVPVPCRVASLREVDWRQLRPNFYVVFPDGVLESAPAMFLIATHLPDAAAGARLQRELGARFANVSTLDLATVIQTLDAILSKVGLAIRFMAGLTMATGLTVLVGAIVSGRGQRVQEAVLLRTLGASRLQVRQILFTEYAVLGVFAALAGLLLAVAASWALARFAFEVEYVWSPLTLLAALGIMPAVTVAVGLMVSRGVAEQSPLEILRQDGTR